jgi:hypothetical protein
MMMPATRDKHPLSTVRRFGSELELPIGLVQQLLRLLGVTAEVPFVGLLRGDDLVERLIHQPLGRGDVRVTFGAHILRGALRPRRRLLSGHRRPMLRPSRFSSLRSSVAGGSMSRMQEPPARFDSVMECAREMMRLWLRDTGGLSAPHWLGVPVVRAPGPIAVCAASWRGVTTPSRGGCGA